MSRFHKRFGDISFTLRIHRTLYWNWGIRREKAILRKLRIGFATDKIGICEDNPPHQRIGYTKVYHIAFIIGELIIERTKLYRRDK